jgi:hypothetical protein
MVVIAVVWLAGSMGFVVGAWWAASMLARESARTRASRRSSLPAHRHAVPYARPIGRGPRRVACRDSGLLRRADLPEEVFGRIPHDLGPHR